MRQDSRHFGRGVEFRVMSPTRCRRYASAVKRAVQAVGALLLLLGVFWTGRESSHGVAALWEHWWCPIPLIASAIGVAGVLAARGPKPAL